MAEIEELRAKVIASMNPSGNSKSKPKGKPTDLGKEGEVPSDEDVLRCSGAPSTIDTSVIASHPTLKCRQRKRLRSGNLPHVNSPSFLADVQQRTTLENNNKNSQLRNKSLNPTLHGSSSSNDNLIISFSDGDDTDSNPEDSNSQRKDNVKGNKEEVNRPRKLLQTSHLQPQIFQRGIDYRKKIVPKKTSIGHPSGLLFTKAHGPYSRILGASDGPAVENQTPVQQGDFTNKIISHKEIGHVSEANVADDKVRSLREQIAVRENVLRLQKMSCPESKDGITLSDGFCSNSSLKMEAKRPMMTSPLDSSISKETKRLKHDEQSSSKVRSDHLSPAQQPLRKSTPEMDGQPLETSCHLGVMNMIGSHQLVDEPVLEKNNAVDKRYGGIKENFCVSSGIHQLQMEDKEPLMASDIAGGTLYNKQTSSSQKEVSLDTFNVMDFNNPYQLTLLEQSRTDRDGLLHLEELHDKELEEAQEFRRQCELKEMHALKAYRKAREALIAANNRCSFLYRKREMLSVIASKWSSCRENFSKTSSDLLAEVDHLMVSERQDFDQVGYKFSSQFIDGPLFTSNLKKTGDDLTSGLTDKQGVNVRHPDLNITLSDHENVFADSEACLPVDDESSWSQIVQGSDVLDVGVKTSRDNGSKRTSPVQHVEDCELEAYLRTKLVAKLGTKSSLKSATKGYNTDGTVVKPIEMVAIDEKSSAHLQMIPSVPNQLLQERQKIVEGSESPGRKCSQATERIIQSDADDLCFKDVSMSIHPEDNGSHPKVDRGPSQVAVFSVPSVLQILCNHFKLLPPELSISHKDLIDVRPKHNMLLSCLPTMGPYNVDFSLDPFWPLCMFELRGKCNDDECPWQHLKCQNRQKTNPVASTNLSSVNQVDSSQRSLVKVNGVHGFPRRLRHNTSSIPTYHIGSYLIEADTLLSQSVLACCTLQYWDIAFCASLSLPLSVQRVLPSYRPVSCAGDVHPVNDDNWNRPSLYFSSEADTTKKLKQGLSDPEQTLEMALDLVKRKMSSMPLKKKVLSLLARALEADPNSVILWIVYLYIYYKKEKSIGKDDMFSYAVKFNQDSYELWHLYIGSRMHFDDRMIAYDSALSVLCQQARAPVEEGKHISACILDLSLQMINSLCIHGDVEKAISRVSELLHPVTDKRSHVLLSDILPCLVTSDRCILWICCLYVVIYRGLPEAVTHQFELEKDLPFVIEWPVTHLSAEEKHRALELLEKAVGALALDNDGGLLEKEWSQEDVQRSAHFLAVNHVKCFGALCGGLDSASDLLAKYVRMHPTCVDLLLISCHLQRNSTSEAFAEGFEEALSNWPRELPGSQRLWNQYAACCLGQGRFELAEKLMGRWFNCFCEDHQGAPSRETETKGELTSSSPPLGASFQSSKEDVAYGFLNLCLYKLMQKSMEEAHLAIGKALDSAAEEEYGRCVREHAVLFACSLPPAESPRRAVLELLSGYLSDARASSSREPLTRKAFGALKKPKLRQLVVSLLGPASADSSLLNSVLETFYGPSLLPAAFEEPRDLVDYVERLMEMAPANHRLATAACEFLCTGRHRPAFTSRGVMFWAGSLLANSIFQCSPAAPEPVWLRGVDFLGRLQIQGLSESFHRQAVSVHPFSLKLWQSWLSLAKTNGDGDSVVEAARKRGFELR